MIITKRKRTGVPIPLLSVFPFEVTTEPGSPRQKAPQITCRSSRDYSTCTYEESAGFPLIESKADVRKDD